MPEAQIIPLNGDDGRRRPARDATDTGRTSGARAKPDTSGTTGRTSTGRAKAAADTTGATRRTSAGRAKAAADTTGTTRRTSTGRAKAAADTTGTGSTRRTAAGKGAAPRRAAGSNGTPKRSRAGVDPAERADRARPAEPPPYESVAASAQAEAEAIASAPAGWERDLAAVLAFARRRLTGDYPVDEFGFDPDLAENLVAPLVRPWYRSWFRVEVRGIENVPSTGAALVVSNHSGTLPIDGVMTALALLDEHPAHRYLRALAADLVFKTPFLAPLARKTGNTLACNADAERLLEAGELVGVWPEGFKGVGKPFSERYKLQRFGRGGFVSAALRTGAPIIPCSVVGAEEIYPMIGNLRPLARLLGFPYLPVTPTFPLLGPLGLVPLPSKWIIEFGEPVDTAGFGPGAADDPMLVFNLTDQVRETIQHSLYRLLMRRRSVFF